MNHLRAAQAGGADRPRSRRVHQRESKTRRITVQLATPRVATRQRALGGNQHAGDSIAQASSSATSAAADYRCRVRRSSEARGPARDVARFKRRGDARRAVDSAGHVSPRQDSLRALDEAKQWVQRRRKSLSFYPGGSRGACPLGPPRRARRGFAARRRYLLGRLVGDGDPGRSVRRPEQRPVRVVCYLVLRAQNR